MDRIDPISHRNGENQRYDDDQRRKDVEHHPEHEKEEIEEDQKAQFGGYVGGDPLEEPHRHLLVNHVVRRREGNTQDNQDPTDQNHGIPHHTGQATKGNVPVDENLDDENIDDGYGRCFRDCKEPAVDPTKNDDRERNLPHRLTQRRRDLAAVEGLPRRPSTQEATLANAVERE